ncbi:hypothetical protein WJX73_002073 [Symbiochloris irregularis]|uniref:Uncharacterized protein n=1 Tax=Symbiochloris irregularis TaxID=706552 RepID=A0AAW1PIX4_9CHLO
MFAYPKVDGTVELRAYASAHLREDVTPLLKEVVVLSSQKIRAATMITVSLHWQLPEGDGIPLTQGRSAGCDFPSSDLLTSISSCGWAALRPP